MQNLRKKLTVANCQDFFDLFVFIAPFLDFEEISSSWVAIVTFRMIASVPATIQAFMETASLVQSQCFETRLLHRGTCSILKLVVTIWWFKEMMWNLQMQFQAHSWREKSFRGLPTEVWLVKGGNYASLKRLFHLQQTHQVREFSSFFHFHESKTFESWNTECRILIFCKFRNLQSTQ